MGTYYLDSDFRVHLDDGKGRIPWNDEHGFFDEKCRAYVEGFRVIPDGMTWTASDGTQYTGFMISACVDYATLDKAQAEQSGMRNAMDAAGVMLTDEQAATVPTLYREWKTGIKYVKDERRLYENTLYKCTQPHTSQKEWTPDASPSLWAKVLIPDPNVIPEWIQPDSTNAYHIGDKVTHNGKTWICTEVDGAGNNTWEPGVYGWSEM